MWNPNAPSILASVMAVAVFMVVVVLLFWMAIDWK